MVALREGVEDDLTAYLVRSLLSEGRINYSVTVRDPKGGWITKTINKEGPTGLIFTTTKARVHGENETRVLSVTSDDSRAQTGRVLHALAADDGGEPDLTEWRELQALAAGRRSTGWSSPTPRRWPSWSPRWRCACAGTSPPSCR